MPDMTFTGLSWFRSRQRKLARGMLALFCLTWLQLALMPCLMASAVSSPMPGPAYAADAAPDDSAMSMDAGEHCLYCPPAPSESDQQDAGHAVCTLSHDPSVDSRASLALGIALPAAAPIFRLTLTDHSQVSAALAAPPLIPHATSLAVSYCRFLK
jgi:hypothetical protein